MEVSIRTTAEVIDYAITARVVIRYSAHRPYEVRMQISEGNETVEWIFGRELLAEGLEPCEDGCWWVQDPAGLGDVCSRCAPDILPVEVSR